MTSRRKFIQTSAASAAHSDSRRCSTFRSSARRRGRSRRRRRRSNILILGGTGFTGPEQVDYAHRARPPRHAVQPQSDAARHVQGQGRRRAHRRSRTTTRRALKGKQFDVVIDNPTTFPAGCAMRRSISRATPSTTSSSRRCRRTPIRASSDSNESSPTAPCRRTRPVHARSAARVALLRPAQECSPRKKSQKHYPDAWTVIRPCLIVGPLDRTDRFTWWPARIDQGGEVLAPDKPDDPCQFIDSRDLAEWTVRVAEMRVLGRYNAIGPDKPIDDRRDAVRRQSDHDGRRAVHMGAVGVPAGAEGSPWRDMTVWQPPYGATAGYQRRDASKAISHGSDLPAARRDREGHARLAQDSPGSRADEDAQRRDQRHRHEARSRGSRSLEGIAEDSDVRARDAAGPNGSGSFVTASPPATSRATRRMPAVSS